MAGGTLRALFEHELKDLRAAEQQIIAALPQMIAEARSDDLKRALEHHLNRTRIHAERLDLILKQYDVAAAANAPSGIDGLVRAGQAMVAAHADGDVRDAAIIDAAQHVEHYEIAGYGCARTFARELEDDRSADLLQQTLDEEGDANKRLTQIAESGVNEAATGGLAEERGRPTRLKYVAASTLPSAETYREVKVRNRAGDDLGRVDGFVLDAANRPYYLVVDSGGLFAGGRYVLPIGKADLRRSDRLLVVDLDKDTLKRYPEFHPDAFKGMSDDEARRYEWRVLEAIDPKAARASTREWTYERFGWYGEPDWFDAGTIAPSAARSQTAPGQPRTPSRPAPATPAREPAERVVAREEAPGEEMPRERIRGRKDNLT